MCFKKKNWTICFILLFVFLAGCSNSEKEAETYYEDVYTHALEASQTTEDLLKELSNAVVDKDYTEVMDLLANQIIPSHKEIIHSLEDAELKDDDLIDFNNVSIEVVNSHEKLYTTIEGIFQQVIKLHDSNQEVQIDKQLENLRQLVKEHMEIRQHYQDESKQITDTYDIFSENELELLPIKETSEEDLQTHYEQLITSFTENVGGSMAPQPRTDVSGQDDVNYEDDLEVFFDGEITINESFVVEGQTNLPKGAFLQIRTFHYGSEHTYIRGETEVDENGEFYFEQDVDEDALTGEPVEVQVQFIPHKFDNKELQEIYGEEGENIQGSFKQKVTDAKRTRTAAIASVLIELIPDEHVSFDQNNWKEPSDYGDYNVWIEENHVDIKDDYYDIYLDSNLIELTGVKASLEVPGYEISGYTSRGVVRPDGTIRLQMPRPDIDDAEIILIIESNSGRSIESEEHYGETGENFEGDLVEKDDKGQKIIFEYTIE